jgi:dolichyl-phosphate-mannose--protein O-mannosyl transferase
MKVPPYFWQGQNASQYLLGNPIVWWGSTALFITALIRVRRRLRSDQRHWLALTGFLVAFVPLWDVKRVLFMYHYLTPLILSLAFGLLWLDRQDWFRAGPLRSQRASYFAVIAAAIAGFIIVSPLTYGFSVGQYDEWLASVVRSWR